MSAWDQCHDAEVILESPYAFAGVHIAEALCKYREMENTLCVTNHINPKRSHISVYVLCHGPRPLNFRTRLLVLLSKPLNSTQYRSYLLLLHLFQSNR